MMDPEARISELPRGWVITVGQVLGHDGITIINQSQEKASN